MSAIFGIADFGGRRVLQPEMDEFASKLAHYGVDGVRTWSDGRMGLGQAMLRVTPESMKELLPSGPEECLGLDEKLAIVADARLDNRDELMASLDIPRAEGRRLPDSQIILAAYARWGTGCAVRLLGDFALAIWDGRARTLYCARDIAGARPFFYSRIGTRMMFSSDLDALLEVQETPPAVNEAYLKGRLLEPFFCHATETLYRGFLSLAPSQWLLATSQGTHVETYWHLGQQKKIRFRNDEDYLSRARDILFEAIECRMRSAFPIGSHLSGGLDSSSITIAAAGLARKQNQQLQAFSWSPPREEWSYQSEDERNVILAVCEQESLECHFASGSQEDRLRVLQRALPFFARFPVSPTLQNARMAQARGIRVMLTGHGGDETFSFPHGEHPMDHLMNRNWFRFWKKAGGEAASSGRNTGLVALRWIAGTMVDHFFPARRKRKETRRIEKPALDPTFFDGRFLRLMRSVSAVKPPEFPVGDRWGFQKTRLAYGHLADRMAAWTAVTANHGIEWRHPFLDRRVIEFCLGIPPYLYCADGRSRYLLRSVLGNRLPEAMSHRDHKSEPGRVSALTALARESLVAFLRAEVTRAPSDYPVVSRDGLKRFLEKHQGGVPWEDCRGGWAQRWDAIQAERLIAARRITLTEP